MINPDTLLTEAQIRRLAMHMIIDGPIALDARGTVRVLETLKGEERSKSIPIVLLTTSSESDIDKRYALGASAYIQKPVSLRVLRQHSER